MLANLAGDEVDVVITEIGGTVGDIESLPFLEAIRQYSLDVGKENCLYIHLTLVPYLKAADELKTKPTQHSVGQLRQIGIQPDILVCRSERELSRDERAKIALFCNVPIEAVIVEKDKDFSIYEVPFSLVEHGLDELIVRRLNLKAGDAASSTNGATCCTGCEIPSTRSPSPWWASTPSIATPTNRSTRRSITPARPIAPRSASSACTAKRWNAKAPNGCSPASTASWSPAASASGESRGRSTPSASPASAGIPFFGICLGMQCAVAEFARNVIGLERANSTEFDKNNPHPVICLLDEQKTITNLGGTMRLGSRAGETARRAAGPRPATARTTITERHRHRYEFNNNYRQQFAAHGMQVSGTSPDGVLVEVDRDPRPSVFRRRAVSSRIQVAADQGASAVRRLHRRRRPTAIEPRRAAGRGGPAAPAGAGGQKVST